LRTEFSGILSELTEKLSANGTKPKKIVANSMFNKLNEFFLELETKNIFEDQELEELTANARQIIADVSPYSLKYNDQAREQIKAQMQGLQRTLEASIIDLPRRTIRLDTHETQLAA